MLIFCCLSLSCSSFSYSPSISLLPTFSPSAPFSLFPSSPSIPLSLSIPSSLRFLPLPVLPPVLALLLYPLLLPFPPISIFLPFLRPLSNSFYLSLPIYLPLSSCHYLSSYPPTSILSLLFPALNFSLSILPPFSPSFCTVSLTHTTYDLSICHTQYKDRLMEP